jgi:transcriptional regulator with XRE-family HTH domain
MEKHAMDMVFNAELFWEDVRAARTARRLSQKTVGLEFGVGGSAVGQWERSKRTPSAVKFLALCTAFELEPSVYGTLISFPAWANQNMFDREKLKSLARVKAPQLQETPYANYGAMIDWNNFRYDENNNREVWHREIGWVLDPYQEGVF